MRLVARRHVQQLVPGDQVRRQVGGGGRPGGADLRVRARVGELEPAEGLGQHAGDRAHERPVIGPGVVEGLDQPGPGRGAEEGIGPDLVVEARARLTI